MKVMCINNSKDAPITPGKMYSDITSNWTEGLDGPMNKIAYLIVNDDGYESWEQKENFITLEEFREQQLNDLGI